MQSVQCRTHLLILCGTLCGGALPFLLRIGWAGGKLAPFEPNAVELCNPALAKSTMASKRPLAVNPVREGRVFDPLMRDVAVSILLFECLEKVRWSVVSHRKKGNQVNVISL